MPRMERGEGAPAAVFGRPPDAVGGDPFFFLLNAIIRRRWHRHKGDRGGGGKNAKPAIGRMELKIDDENNIIMVCCHSRTFLQISKSESEVASSGLPST